MMNMQGWVGSREARPEVGEEGAGPGEGGVEQSGSEVGKCDGSEDGGNLAGLAVKEGWRVCRFVSTLIDTLESKVEK